MPHKPHVSVIMACYNASSFVLEAIKSVMQQSFQDVELIIVDDASTDMSLDLVKRSAQADTRIRVLSMSRQVGASAARNYAIQHASGEWLAILDADDVFLPEKIERQLKFIRNSVAGLVLLGTNSYEIDGQGNRLSMQCYPAEGKKLIKHLSRMKRFPPHSSIMYNASAVRSIGCFNPLYHRSMDYDLWLRLSDLGPFASLGEPLVKYRHHNTNISTTNAGFEQLRYAVAALTCHFLRKNGFKDPSQTLLYKEWDIFLEWVSRKLCDSDFCRVRQKSVFERHRNINGQDKLRLALRYFRSLDVGGEWWAFISERLWGSKFPESLAKEWMLSSLMTQNK